MNTRKLLTQLERITKTIEYYIGFDTQSKTWRVMRRQNGKIFGSFLKKENAAQYAKVAATIEYRKKENSKKTEFTIDGISYNGNILEEVMMSDVDCDIADDELEGGIYEF